MCENKLYIFLIFSILEVTKRLICHHSMHNLYTIFAKFLHICKEFSDNLVNEHGNIPRPGVIPHFSDLEVISLSLTMESIGLDSENYSFSKLREYSNEMSHLISRRQFNSANGFTLSFSHKNKLLSFVSCSIPISLSLWPKY